MLFNSYIFILAFLPLLLIAYYGLLYFEKAKIALVLLIVASFIFYGYFVPYYLIILIASIVINYIFSRSILSERKKDVRKAKLITGGGIAFNVLVIFYFKYWDFFIENINFLFRTNFESKYILLPLGISFFTFQQISYIVDTYRGETEGYSFIEYCAFVSFFPQLVAGPIVLHSELIPQFKDAEKHKINWENIANGIFCFSVGLFKKVLIADTFGKAVATGFEMYASLNALEIMLVVLFYTFQIYFDFSGYCDMAVGIGRMLNIELPINFNSPYRSRSIIEFWERWHISLTRFLRTYIYFPLGGSKKGKAHTYANVMAVFLISGLWHGANWTFICWGALHGMASVLNRIFKNSWNRLNKCLQWLITFCFINFTWLIFRVESMTQLETILKRFSELSFIVREETLKIISGFSLIELRVIEQKVLGRFLQNFDAFNMFLFSMVAFWVIWKGKPCSIIKIEPSFRWALGTAILLIWGIFSLSEISAFLYFNF